MRFRRSIVLGFLAVVAVLTVLVSHDAAAQQSITVDVTNSGISAGESEVVFEGPRTATIGEGVEYTGFGGFDIDLTADRITMRWSTDARFDAFEGTFDDQFSDIYTFVFSGVDYANARADTSTNLVPSVAVRNGAIRVVFADGDIYGDGREAVILLTRVNATIVTPTPTAESTGTDVTVDAPVEPSAAATPFRPENPFDRPNPVPSQPLDMTSPTPEVTSEHLAATGQENAAALALAAASLALGASLIVIERRSKRALHAVG